MCHAAFENYLEKITTDIVENSVSDFNKNGKINKCIVSLIVSETIAQFDEGISRKPIKSKIVSDLGKFVNIAKRNHIGVISGNNGIKIRDQKALLNPVGLNSRTKCNTPDLI